MAAMRPRLRIVDPKKVGQRVRKGVFLLPNLITTGALFAGFFAIVAAVDSKFEIAAVAVFVAMILDSLDGRVARMTRTESEFGAQFDSLSDMVAFGVAPALIAFEWSLQELNQFGWSATFLYMACAALRLARFNTTGSSQEFTGLPSPMAAGFIASAVWLCSLEFGPQSTMALNIATLCTVVLIGILMVSNISYFSPKLLSVKGKVPFVVFVVIALVITLVLAHPSLVLFVVSGGYVLSGLIGFVWNRYLQDQIFH